MKYNRCIRKSAIMKANAEKRAVGKRDFVIAYGDGGKGMNNLKGTPSAPNVSIKRHMEQFFHVVVQNEYYTSQTCPCCQERSLKKKTFKNKLDDTDIEKHHLLRCTNDKCESRLWNRNVVGSFNILKKCLLNIEAPHNTSG